MTLNNVRCADHNVSIGDQEIGDVHYLNRAR